MKLQPDNLYKERYSLFFSDEDEYNQTVLDLIQQNILPKIASPKALLDIGAGPGTFSLGLANYFDHIGIVEINPQFCVDVTKKLLLLDKIVTACNIEWQTVSFDIKFDLILCFHVLYYVQRSEWQAFIKKSLNSLTTNGRLVIILIDEVSPTGGQLFELFLGSKDEGYYAEDLMACLSEMNQTYEYFKISYSLNIQTTDDLLNMVAFILQGDNSVNTRLNLEQIYEKRLIAEQVYKNNHHQYNIHESATVFALQKQD